MPILFMYALVSSIVLVNLLVAMFSDTYATVKSNSEIEFRFQKKYMVFLYQVMAPDSHRVPPSATECH